MSFWSILFSDGFLVASARRGVVLLSASTGEIFSERAGILNVHLEGMVLAGAFGGVYGSHLFGNVWAGVAVGLLSGALVSAIHGIVVIKFDGDQVVSGVAINIAVFGLTIFLSRLVFGVGQTISVDNFHPFEIPVLTDIPILGALLFRHDPIAYIVFGMALLAWFMLYRTRWGLELRACGESPSTADAMGVPVNRLRWQALLICGALGALGGVHLSLGVLSTFFENMSAGRGFIALAVVIAAKWNPLRAVLIALLFGGAEALGVRIQAAGVDLPFQLIRALPYVLTLLVYAGVIGRAREPASLAQRWLR